MKTAEAEIDSFILICPHCGGLLISPDNGSLTWPISYSAPKVATCSECGEKSKVPKRIPGHKIPIDSERTE